MRYLSHRGISVFCGDSFAILPALPMFDHCITDPPFSDSTHEGARSAKGIKTTKAQRQNGIARNAPKLIDFESFDERKVRDAFSLCALRTRRWLISTLDFKHTVAMQHTPPVGLRFIRAGVWIKPNGAPQFDGTRPGTGWESVALLHTPRATRWNGGGHHAVWRHPRPHNQAHKTEKPVALYREWIRQFTDPHEIIVDPFCGAGSLLVAAVLEGRRAVGIELDDKWARHSAQRLEDVFRTEPEQLEIES